MHSTTIPTNISSTQLISCGTEISVEHTSIHIQPTSMKNSAGVVINRPQSPRQFFEKLYGHLENNGNNNNNNHIDTTIIGRPIISPIIESDISSSPDVNDL